MFKPPGHPKNNTQQSLVQFFISDLPCIILSLALFLGGIWVLSLRIPGWSLFFGLIITPLGLAFCIYTLDDVAKNMVAPPPFKPIKCNVCGKNTFAKEAEEDVICGKCRKDIQKEILKERLKSQAKIFPFCQNGPWLGHNRPKNHPFEPFSPQKETKFQPPEQQ